jgi:hypothetical protein
MSDFMVNRIGSARVAVDNAAWQGQRQGRQQPRKRRQQPATLASHILAAYYPGRDPEEFEIAYETAGKAFIGLVIRDARSGDVLRTLSPDELARRAPGAGSIFERRG